MQNSAEIDNLIFENNNLRKITEITKIINSTLDISKLLHAVMESIKEIMDTEASSLLFYDPETDELVFKAAVGEAGEELSEKYRINTNEGIAGYCAKTKKSVLVNNVYDDDRFNRQVDQMTGFKTNSIIAAPLLFKGKLIGVIEAINPIKNDEFSEHDLELFELFADQAVMAVQNAIIFEKSVFNTRVKSEIEKAKKIQQHILKSINANNSIYSLSAKTFTASDLGGEFFRIISKNNSPGILLGDVHSKGIHSSLSSNIIIGAAEGLGTNYADKPLLFGKHLTNFIKENLVNFHEISLFYGYFNNSEKKIEFINTGFAYPILIRNSKSHYLKFNTHTLNSAKLNETSLPTKINVKLQTNDIFLIVTDGLVNLKSNSGKCFGLKEIMEIAEKHSSSPSQLLQTLREKSLQHIQEMKQFEDITIICFKVN